LTLSANETVSKLTLKQRRIARFQREIALLEQMDASIWRKAMWCSSLSILGAAAAVVLVVYWYAGFAAFTPLALALSLCGGVAALLAIRHWNVVLWIVFWGSILLLLAIIFEGIEDAFWPDSNSVGCGEFSDISSMADVLDFGGGEKRKNRRRVECAIARRKMRLERLLARSCER
jgi:hypothetical protein